MIEKLSTCAVIIYSIMCWVLIFSAEPELSAQKDAPSSLALHNACK